MEEENYQLPDSAWHVKDFYEYTRSQVVASNPKDTPCYEFDEEMLPAARQFCSIPFKARTEFQPRANAAETSIRSIMKMPENREKLTPTPNSYNPPDVYNIRADTPDGEINYLNIIENGVDFAPTFYPKVAALRPIEYSTSNIPPTPKDGISPGKGWYLDANDGADSCNGEYDNWCNRGPHNGCMLSGHNDNRGGLYFDSLSGWGIFNLKGLEHGVIVLKVETWHQPKDNPGTKGFQSVNNETGTEQKLPLDEYDLSNLSVTCNIRERREKGRRELGGPKAPLFCKDWRFEYTINGGKVKSWDPFEVCEHLSNVQRVVQQITLLNDPDFVEAGKAADVELAMRMVGCGRQVTWKLTHMYWA